MQGVGVGKVIGGRYALVERRAHWGPLEVWVGTDQSLQRQVSLTLFPMEAPRASAILDAARRAASFNDHRMIRVWDVGSADGVGWVIEEPLGDSQSLAQLLQKGPLPPEEARRIVGEAATALESARGRGLHHLRLDPHAVRRTHRGNVRIAGLAIAACIEGVDEADAEKASAADALALIGLLYATLTTRWPLGRVVGLDTAPKIGSHVAEPAQIAAEVPPDLNRLCASVLSGKQPVGNPGDVAEMLGTWATLPVESTPAAKEPSMSQTSSKEPASRAKDAPADEPAQATQAGKAAHAGKKGAAAVAAGAGVVAAAHARSAADERNAKQAGESASDAQPSSEQPSAENTTTQGAAAGKRPAPDATPSTSTDAAHRGSEARSHENKGSENSAQAASSTTHPDGGSSPNEPPAQKASRPAPGSSPKDASDSAGDHPKQSGNNSAAKAGVVGSAAAGAAAVMGGLKGALSRRKGGDSHGGDAAASRPPHPTGEGISDQNSPNTAPQQQVSEASPTHAERKSEPSSASTSEGTPTPRTSSASASASGKGAATAPPPAQPANSDATDATQGTPDQAPTSATNQSADARPAQKASPTSATSDSPSGSGKNGSPAASGSSSGAAAALAGGAAAAGSSKALTTISTGAGKMATSWRNKVAANRAAREERLAAASARDRAGAVAREAEESWRAQSGAVTPPPAAEGSEMYALTEPPSTGAQEKIVPMIPVASSTKVPANQVKPLLLGIGAVVALVFGISLYSLLGGGSGNDEHAVQNLPASMQTTAKAAPSDPAKPTPGATPTIEAATGYDPDGDGNENGRLAGRAHDGKSETFWKSEGYDGGNFAGKDGIGVVFSLSKEVPLRTVELEFPQEGYDVEIWLSDANDSIEKATKIGGKEGTGSKESFTVPEGTPAKRHIVVYYTKGVENDGRLYARLSEIKVT